MAMQLMWTNAGYAALVNADNTGTLPIECKYIAIGTGTTTAKLTDTELEAEVKRIETIGGQVVDDNTIHVVMRDESMDVYVITEIGLIAADGTLLARYAQAQPIVSKAANAVALLAIDAAFTDIDITQITFPTLVMPMPPWSESVQGVVQRASQNEVLEGTNKFKGITPKLLQDAVRTWFDTGAPDNDGILEARRADRANYVKDQLGANQRPSFVNNLNTLRGTQFFACSKQTVGAPNIGFNYDANGWQVDTDGQRTQFVSASTSPRSLLMVRLDDSNDSSGDWSEWVSLYEPMPVGATYIQFPGKATPSSLYGGKWDLVFENEGIFFRTEGGEASAFGSGIQGDAIRNITGKIETKNFGAGDGSLIFNSTGALNKVTNGGTSTASVESRRNSAIMDRLEFDASRSVPTAPENRPRNRTIRIWERTA